MGIFYNEQDGLAVTGYAGDRTVLLAFDLPEAETKDLAGFSIAVSRPNREPDVKKRYFLGNRLSFEEGVTAKTAYDEKIWTPSDKAPFQAFHWAHYPSLGFGRYTYTVFATYFAGDSVQPGPSVDLPVDLIAPAQGAVSLGFTRTMISSQAYAQRFGNQPLYPDPQSVEPYDAEYTGRHTWLGAHARELVMGFLDTCRADPGVTLDAFTYDLDESAIIRSICALGARARVYQDNSSGHCCAGTDVEGMRSTKVKKEPPLEPEAVRALRDAGVGVKTGNFDRQSHNKVFIRRRNGVAEAVLTGSANFTIRGLYVQANSVMVFEDARVAGLYAQAFDQAWSSSSAAEFRRSPVAQQWHEVLIGGTRYRFSFAPHETAWPLDEIKAAIDRSERSVLFAMMQMSTSTGAAIEAIRGLPAREDLFSMGVIQHAGDIGSFKPDTGDENFTHASAAYLARKVPPPFRKEISGGSGQVIHHKMVVCDFNGRNPVVFCGSSNLAEGGEKANSDNLMAIHDRDIAVMFAVETIRQYQHFRFRSLQEKATTLQPLRLKPTDEWTRPYYETGNIRRRERESLMAREN